MGEQTEEMNLTKFLLLDGALILVGVPFLLILRDEKGKLPLFGDLNKNKTLDTTSTTFPQLNELLALELLARKEGSGIEFNSLIGLWNFVSVWKAGTDKNDSIASSLLRLFSASLDINKDKSKQLSISNSIQFGLLSIHFLGVKH